MKNTTIATNRKAFHEYVIIESYEAGIQLMEGSKEYPRR